MADTTSDRQKPARALRPETSQPVWLSYDLGVKGDYEGLYTWLDDHKATECGDSLAYFIYTYSADLKAELTEELKRAISLTNVSRFYAIFVDPSTKKSRGSFLFGSRRSAPWAGRGADRSQPQIDEG